MRYIYILITLIGSIVCLRSQTTNDITESNEISVMREISLKMIYGRTPALDFERNYPVESGKGDVASDGSSIFALCANYSRTLRRNLMWDVGLETGLNSYYLRVIAGEEFLDLGWEQPYISELTFHDVFYSSGILSLRYNIPVTQKSLIIFKAGVRASFFLPIVTDIQFGASPQPSQSFSIFSSSVQYNEKDNFIISPDLGVGYSYKLSESKVSLNVIINTSFSRKEILAGDYKINGDQETLEGKLSKKMVLLILGLGASYSFQ